VDILDIEKAKNRRVFNDLVLDFRDDSFRMFNLLQPIASLQFNKFVVSLRFKLSISLYR